MPMKAQKRRQLLSFRPAGRSGSRAREAKSAYVRGVSRCERDVSLVSTLTRSQSVKRPFVRGSFDAGRGQGDAFPHEISPARSSRSRLSPFAARNHQLSWLRSLKTPTAGRIDTTLSDRVNQLCSADAD